MIDQLSSLNALAAPKNANTGNEIGETRRVLKMVKNERMGGYVPRWETVTVTKKHEIEQTLATAQNGQIETGETFKSTLAYQDTSTNSEPGPQEEFKFADLIDMVNPLHHIPVVGHLYRNISGDEIKPISKIIGGAVFGGAAGAAAGLINTVVEKETGKDLAENAIALAMNGEAPKLKNPTPSSGPEKILSEAVQIAQQETRPNNLPNNNSLNDLPGALLAFADLGHKSGFSVEKISAANGRTAGSFVKKSYPDIEVFNLPGRIPITEVILRAMPDGKF